MTIWSPNWIHPTSRSLSCYFQESSANEIRSQDPAMDEIILCDFYCSTYIYLHISYLYKTGKVSIRHLLGGVALKPMQESLASAQSSSFKSLSPEEHFVMFLGPTCLGFVFFFYIFRDGLESHPTRCSQLHLFQIYLHANETLRRRFLRMEKGVRILPWIFFILCRHPF